jgi:hypothetical protein
MSYSTKNILNGRTGILMFFVSVRQPYRTPGLVGCTEVEDNSMANAQLDSNMRAAAVSA